MLTKVRSSHFCDRINKRTISGKRGYKTLLVILEIGRARRRLRSSKRDSEKRQSNGWVTSTRFMKSPKQILEQPADLLGLHSIVFWMIRFRHALAMENSTFTHCAFRLLSKF